ncbi:hypothetical protein [Actinomadura pelletieri]|uniref:hypothetical protein n=1 Tax=Actinomadura pelletieri TaxID=111805 RepID=UPI0011C3B13E|nr:hypothetical protein [Actinomadura pelletieri]
MSRQLDETDRRSRGTSDARIILGERHRVHAQLHRQKPHEHRLELLQHTNEPQTLAARPPTSVWPPTSTCTIPQERLSGRDAPGGQQRRTDAGWGD